MSPTSRPSAPLARRALALAAVGAGYYVCALVGTVLSLPPSDFAILWPATAFLTAALLVLPPRDVWLTPLVVVPAHLLLMWSAPSGPAPLLVALTQVAGNLGLAGATAFAVRKADAGPLRLDTFRSALVFILLSGLVVPAVVNALILAVHLATGWTQDFWLAWRQWMLASVFPTITLTPLVVLGAQGRILPSAPPLLRIEAALLCPALFAIGVMASGSRVEAEYWPALLLTPLPLLLWAAVRWGVGGACLALLVFAGAVLVRALAGGGGPFAAHSAVASVLSLQVYLISISIPLILLAALMDERRAAGEQLRRSEARMEIAAASTDTGLWQWDAATQGLWMTDHCGAMFGLPPGTGLSFPLFNAMLHPDDRVRVSQALKTVGEVDIATLREFRILRGGAVRWFILRTHADRDREGRLIRINGVFRDITRRVEAQQEAEQLSRQLLTLQEDERRNIAEQLHDSTGQHLAALGLTLRMLQRRLKLTPATRPLFDDIKTSLKAAQAELRTFTYLLRPPEPAAQGLRFVLRQYVGGFGVRAGLPTVLRLTPRADDLPIDQQHTLLRITQECLTNIYRHARAQRVSVGLRMAAGRLHLVIRDDGRGMPLADAGAPEIVRMGVGIPGMAARIRHLGGQMAIRSDARGTTVHVVLPLGEAASRPIQPAATRAARRMFTETVV
jgi:signal transduction histidine kinase